MQRIQLHPLSVLAGAGGLALLSTLAGMQTAGSSELTPEQREILDRMRMVDAGGTPTIEISGVNVRLVNGLGATSAVNGLGNLIIGYNEMDGGSGLRTGSHNLIGGTRNSYSSWGGFVFGDANEISGPLCTISGGFKNRATGGADAVCGGFDNLANGFESVVGGGRQNTASGQRSWVAGGTGNDATGIRSAACGGFGNTSSGDTATVSGGIGNTSSGFASAVSGGVGNLASGDRSSVSGGSANHAAGEASSVSGGHLRGARRVYDWAAGELFQDH